jgi:hypothetical protein
MVSGLLLVSAGCDSEGREDGSAGQASGGGAGMAGSGAGAKGGAPAMTGGSGAGGNSASGSAGRSTGGSASDGGSSGHAGSGGASGGGGAGSQLSCAPASIGVWKMIGYEAYLQVGADCQVPLFCDVVEGHRTTGYLDGDMLTLTDLATLEVMLVGDTLTLVDAGPSGTEDLPFQRQTSADVIPQACLP